MKDYTTDPVEVVITKRGKHSIAQVVVGCEPWLERADNTLRYIWHEHEVDGDDNNLSSPAPFFKGEDFTVRFSDIAKTMIEPEGLPPLPVAALAEYIKAFGYQLLAQKREGTGPFVSTTPEISA